MMKTVPMLNEVECVSFFSYNNTNKKIKTHIQVSHLDASHTDSTKSQNPIIFELRCLAPCHHTDTPQAPPGLLSLCPLFTVTATGRPWQAQTLMLSLSAPHLRPRLCRNLAHRTKGNRWCTTVHGMTSVSVGWGGLTVTSMLTEACRGRRVGGGGGRGVGEERRIKLLNKV